MKHTKYLLLASLACVAGAFADDYKNYTIFDLTNCKVCIWTAMPGDPSNYDAYKMIPGMASGFSPNMMLSSCPKDGSPCTAKLAWSKPEKGDCVYGSENIHPLPVQVTWSNVVPGISYGSLKVDSSDPTLKFSYSGNRITIEGTK